jgi:hypothetical protein
MNYNLFVNMNDLDIILELVNKLKSIQRLYYKINKAYVLVTIQ